MENDCYLRWLVNETPTRWWHDSGDPDELDKALTMGASGVTTNPVLTWQALKAKPDYWRARVESPNVTSGSVEKVELLMQTVAIEAARKLQPQHQASKAEASSAASGYVCAQVSPSKAGDRKTMLDMARRFHTWAPNIAVKLPVTAAGLDVLEECVAEGITVTATVSFTVPQVLAVADRHRRGVMRARQDADGHRPPVTPGHCFAVIMIGRLDDYLRDVAKDCQANITEADIRLAGLAVTKRAYALFQAEKYEATLLVAALRGTYHMTGLAGADLVMSIHPVYQKLLSAESAAESGAPRQLRITDPIATDAIQRLQNIREFVRSYEPDGMRPEEFITFGLTQRTLAQFHEAGWAMLESFDLRTAARP